MATPKIVTDEEISEHLRILEEFNARVQSRQYRTEVIPVRFITQITRGDGSRVEKKEAEKRL